MLSRSFVVACFMTWKPVLWPKNENMSLDGLALDTPSSRASVRRQTKFNRSNYASRNSRKGSNVFPWTTFMDL